MVDLVNKLRQLKTIPEPVHWFCPRDSDEDDTYYFAEDLAGQTGQASTLDKGREGKLREAEERRLLVLDCLQILAFDGSDAAKWQLWLKARLGRQLTTCDVCIRIYHRSRKDLRTQLEELYETTEVLSFLRILEDIDIQRIKAGLQVSKRNLLSAPADKRDVSALENSGLYAIFEALSCEPFLRDETLLSQHFDEPFQLVQSKKKLKLNNLSPAVTYFLFSRNEFRRKWAQMTWSRHKGVTTGSEFDSNVREPFLYAMSATQLQQTSMETISRFWSGASVILGKLEKDLITHKLRALDIDICRFIIEHLQFVFPRYEDLLLTMQLLLTKSPTDFWDAMGAISPVTIAEQIFSSPGLERALLEHSKDSQEYSIQLTKTFGWILPFLLSIRASNQAPVCRSLAAQLLDRYQSSNRPTLLKKFCYALGLKVIVATLACMNKQFSTPKPVSHAIITELSDLVNEYIQKVLRELMGLDLDGHLNDTATLCRTILEEIFALDCRLLISEADLVKSGAIAHSETKVRPLWRVVENAIVPGNLMIADAVLEGCKSLVGLESPYSKKSTDSNRDRIAFEEAMKGISEFTSVVLERLTDFDPKDLASYFSHVDSATAILAPLFHSDELVHRSSIELLKLMSLQTGRKEAIEWLLEKHYIPLLSGATTNMHRIAQRGTFAPSLRMLRICTDITDILTDPQTGMLRSKSLTVNEAKITQSLWICFWDCLTVIFSKTEAWSNMGHNKNDMMDFCRDVMQFADFLFDQYGIFANAIDDALQRMTAPKATATSDDLLKRVRNTMTGMVRWLRLRDEYLSNKSVTLVCKMLKKFKEVSITASEDALRYVCDVISGTIRAKLSHQQIAELERALEGHVDNHPRLNNTSKSEDSVHQSQLSIKSWMSSSATVRGSGLASATRVLEQAKSGKQSTLDIRVLGHENKAQSSRRTKAPEIRGLHHERLLQPVNHDYDEFKRQRELEKEEKRKRDSAAILAAKKNLPLRGATQASDASLKLAKLAATENDRALRGSGMMVSSDEESEHDSDDALDRELFGLSKKSEKSNSAKDGGQLSLNSSMKAVLQPVKKRRLVRSTMDMRARLAPDLSPLLHIILGWNFTHDGDYPPHSTAEDYHGLPKTFRTPSDYQRSFQPLLLLEAWQSLVKAREEMNYKPFEIKISNRSSVDAFVEVGSTIMHADNKEMNIAEGDICLMTKSRTSAKDVTEACCLSRVWRVTRKKNWLEILYRLIPGNPLIPSLSPNVTVYGLKLYSIIPLEREYGALLGLQYYDLCDEILKAKPSPLLPYSDKQLENIVQNYTVNIAQAKAIKSALDNDAFTLIQGPPGSGKTKTIVAIVGALLTGNMPERGVAIDKPKAAGAVSVQVAPKKLLVCAPSNAAVDELIMRFKKGVKTTCGEHRRIRVVRLGRTDSVNTAVVDVTLEELVNQRLGGSHNQSLQRKVDMQALMKEHQTVSAKLNEARTRLGGIKMSVKQHEEIKASFDACRRQKAQLSAQIDTARDNENLINRQTDLNRKRAQQAILEESHVICATLSGSGHDMFQSLSIDFETVVVDEAAQCVEVSALIPLKYGCAKCILVGDPKQLPPTVFSKEAARFQYEQSLFVRMQVNHPQDVHLLDTQYRMHPDISLFPSKTFYDGRLLDGPNMAMERKRAWHANRLLSPYRFINVQGQHQMSAKGRSLVNMGEIEAAILLYRTLISSSPGYQFAGKVGIITPYKSQLKELKTRFAKAFGDTAQETIDFSTTDAFQGREKEVIIFSCVRASADRGIGFLQDIRRMNVGLTRAQSSLWVLGNSQSLMRGAYWRKLINDAQERGLYSDGKELIDFAKQGPVVSMISPTTESMPDRPTAIKSESMAREQSNEGATRRGSSSGLLGLDTSVSVGKGIKVEGAHYRRPKEEYVNSTKKPLDVKIEVKDSTEQTPRAENFRNSGADTDAITGNDAAHDKPQSQAGAGLANNKAPTKFATKNRLDLLSQAARLNVPKRKKVIDPFIHQNNTKRTKPG